MYRASALPFLFVTALALLAAGCNKQPQSTQVESAEDAEFAVRYKKAAVDSLWEAMIASNDKKIANTTYFLNIAKGIIDDSAEVHLVRQANDSLLSLRYNQANLRQLVDRYDSVENRVLQGLGTLYNNHKEVQIINTSQALEEIKAADDSVLIFRYSYDKVVKEYNETLKTHAKTLKHKPEYQPLVMFQINP